MYLYSIKGIGRFNIYIVYFNSIKLSLGFDGDLGNFDKIKYYFTWHVVGSI